jgi:hypothetical protein
VSSGNVLGRWHQPRESGNVPRSAAGAASGPQTGRHVHPGRTATFRSPPPALDLTRTVEPFRKVVDDDLCSACPARS